MISKVEGAEQVQRLPLSTLRNSQAAGIEIVDPCPSSKPATGFAQLFVSFSLSYQVRCNCQSDQVDSKLITAVSCPSKFRKRWAVATTVAMTW